MFSKMYYEVVWSVRKVAFKCTSYTITYLLDFKFYVLVILVFVFWVEWEIE